MLRTHRHRRDVLHRRGGNGEQTCPKKTAASSLGRCCYWGADLPQTRKLDRKKRKAESSDFFAGIIKSPRTNLPCPVRLNETGLWNATAFAQNAGVIGLLASILVWISSYTAYLWASVGLMAMSAFCR